MYIPASYKQDDIENIRQLIRENPFAILVNILEGKPWATHIPLVFSKRNGVEVLTGHISKDNKQWHAFKNNKEVLAIFSGGNAYISSSWYNHEEASTWNYEAVHVYGRIQLLAGDELKASIQKLIDHAEEGNKKAIHLHHMSDTYVNKAIQGVVGFEIEIKEINAVSKLSQDKNDENIKRVIDALEKQDSKNAKAMAEKMKIPYKNNK
jgi:transcriptional regulator